MSPLDSVCTACMQKETLEALGCIATERLVQFLSGNEGERRGAHSCWTVVLVD